MDDPELALLCPGALEIKVGMQGREGAFVDEGLDRVAGWVANKEGLTRLEEGLRRDESLKQAVRVVPSDSKRCTHLFWRICRTSGRRRLQSLATGVVCADFHHRPYVVFAFVAVLVVRVCFISRQWPVERRLARRDICIVLLIVLVLLAIIFVDLLVILVLGELRQINKFALDARCTPI